MGRMVRTCRENFFKPKKEAEEEVVLCFWTKSCLKEDLAAWETWLPPWGGSQCWEPANLLLNNKFPFCSSQCELVSCYLQPQQRQNQYIHFITWLFISVLHPCHVYLTINPVWKAFLCLTRLFFLFSFWFLFGWTLVQDMGLPLFSGEHLFMDSWAKMDLGKKNSKRQSKSFHMGYQISKNYSRMRFH